MSKFTVDPELIRALAAVLNETGLGEIEFAEGDRRIRVARPAAAAVASVAPMVHHSAAGSPPTATPSKSDGPPANAITSPMVGTAYMSPSPGAPPFVKPGDRVNEGATLLIIEAMKVMNPIKAPRAGVIREVMIANGAPIEYGEPLLILD